MLRGAVSWGHRMCRTDHYTVFARLSSFIEWINGKKSGNFMALVGRQPHIILKRLTSEHDILHLKKNHIVCSLGMKERGENKLTKVVWKSNVLTFLTIKLLNSLKML